MIPITDYTDYSRAFTADSFGWSLNDTRPLDFQLLASDIRTL